MRTAIAVLGVDIGKNVCSLVGLDVFGRPCSQGIRHRYR